MGLVAATDPADETPAGKVVEHGDFFGQAQGLPEWEHQHGRSDLQPRRFLRDVEGLQEWRRGHPVVGEVVFGNEDEIKAHLL
jgi:hypothetical protein